MCPLPRIFFTRCRHRKACLSSLEYSATHPRCTPVRCQGGSHHSLPLQFGCREDSSRCCGTQIHRATRMSPFGRPSPWLSTPTSYTQTCMCCICLLRLAPCELHPSTPMSAHRFSPLTPHDLAPSTVSVLENPNRSDPGFFLREAAKLGEEYEIERQVVRRPMPHIVLFVFFWSTTQLCASAALSLSVASASDFV